MLAATGKQRDCSWPLRLELDDAFQTAKAAREVGVVGDGHGDELGEGEGMRRASTACRGAVPDAIIKGPKGARGLISRLEGWGVRRRGWWAGWEQAVAKGAPRQEDLTPEPRGLSG